MLDHRLRRWSNIERTLGQCIVSVGWCRQHAVCVYTDSTPADVEPCLLFLHCNSSSPPVHLPNRWLYVSEAGPTFRLNRVFVFTVIFCVMHC